jgi:hypothetical protein
MLFQFGTPLSLRFWIFASISSLVEGVIYSTSEAGALGVAFGANGDITRRKPELTSVKKASTKSNHKIARLQPKTTTTA